MISRALLWASTNATMAEQLPRFSFVRRATRRFLPGETLADALEAAQKLAEAGIATTLGRLGEEHTTPQEADAVVEHYEGALGDVARRGLDVEITLKPTQMGVGMASGAEGALERVLSVAAASPGMVWLDMERSVHVDATLDLYRRARERGADIGLCLQSYLRRSEADLESLMPLDPSIRVVKGAYREPPEVAFPRKGDVDRNFVRLLSTLLRAKSQGGRGRPVVGTHDPAMLGEASRLAFELGLDKSAYECAMLYGIARDEQERLARSGYRVRVLVSYGTAWFPWYMRRLAERPANLWFVAKQLVTRG